MSAETLSQMILVDTSIWIEHFRSGSRGLSEALDRSAVLMHPFVVGELACGALRNRAETIHLLRRLPAAPIATEAEALDFLDVG